METNQSCQVAPGPQPVRGTQCALLRQEVRDICCAYATLPEHPPGAWRPLDNPGKLNSRSLNARGENEPPYVARQRETSCRR
jgi:hypothetical protein